ncbi:MAG: hypothetical protein V4724_25530 [Pseudomonadota bacterium]
MKFWKWKSEDQASPAVQGSWIPLRVASRAMCCAVGHNAPAATAAINARMNHFRETEFVDDSDDPIIGSALYDVPVWGAERLRAMLHAVAAESLHALNRIEHARIAILLLTPEAERPGMPHDTLADDLAQLVAGDVEGMGPFHPRSGMYACGKGGIARGLHEAALLLSGVDALDYVLLAAVDSLLDAGAIEHFLAEERLATTVNADGFIPGEGAAAIVLSAQAAELPGLWIESAATAQENWRIHGDVPLRATGLTAAIREAARLAGISIGALDFHASGMTGEAWYAKEVSMAVTRVLEERKPEFPHLMVAGRVGETGTAAPVLTLAWLADVMGRADSSPGHSALLHFAGDDGHRAALIVRHRT